jgi:hypothetical protein
LLKDLSTAPPSRITSSQLPQQSLSNEVSVVKTAEPKLEAVRSRNEVVSQPPAPINNVRSSTVPRGDAHKDLERLVANVPESARSSAIPQAQSYSKSKAHAICASCNLDIEDVDQAITAIGKIFHKEHFQCVQCTRMLSGGLFFEKEGKPYCEKCMNENFLLPKCAYCGEIIKGKCINALDKNWHPDHFFCSQCGRHFPAGAGFLERDGKAYCEEDYYNMFAPKCASCDQPITDEVVTALGKSFHSTCFVCAEPSCKVSLADSGNFFEHNGKQYCETHYHAARGSLCASCQKPISGRCLTGKIQI